MALKAHERRLTQLFQQPRATSHEARLLAHYSHLQGDREQLRARLPLEGGARAPPGTGAFLLPSAAIEGFGRFFAQYTAMDVACSISGYLSSGHGAPMGEANADTPSPRRVVFTEGEVVTLPPSSAHPHRTCLIRLRLHPASATCLCCAAKLSRHSAPLPPPTTGTGVSVHIGMCGGLLGVEHAGSAWHCNAQACADDACRAQVESATPASATAGLPARCSARLHVRIQCRHQGGRRMVVSPLSNPRTKDELSTLWTLSRRAIDCATGVWGATTIDARLEQLDALAAWLDGSTKSVRLAASTQVPEGTSGVGGQGNETAQLFLRRAPITKACIRTPHGVKHKHAAPGAPKPRYEFVTRHDHTLYTWECHSVQAA